MGIWEVRLRSTALLKDGKKSSVEDIWRMVGKVICHLVFGMGRQTGGCGGEGDTERGTQQTRLALRREVGEGDRRCRLGGGGDGCQPAW